jgi:hypothetical protein
MKFIKPVALCLFVVALSSCAHASRKGGGAAVGNLENYDLVFDGVPRQVEWIQAGAFANAIEKDVEGLEEIEIIVAFRVLDLHKGEDVNDEGKKKSLPRLKPTVIVQKLFSGDLKEIFKKDPLKTEGDIKQRWFRIGVKDPYDSFEISDWENPEQNAHRIYLNRYGDDRYKNTYVMVKAEQL